MEARWMGFSFWLNIYHSWYLPWRQKQALFLTWKRASEKATGTVGHHLFDTMCPTAFLAPTLTAKTCFICTQPQNAFFLAQLALQGNRANGKKSLPGRVPGPKKGTKMVPKSGVVSRRILLAQWPKKVQKIGPGPALAWTWSAEKGSSSGKRHREMPNLRLKVPTQRRPAQCSSGDRLPEQRSYHVLWGALDLRVTKLYF